MKTQCVIALLCVLSQALGKPTHDSSVNGGVGPNTTHGQSHGNSDHSPQHGPLASIDWAQHHEFVWSVVSQILERLRDAVESGEISLEDHVTLPAGVTLPDLSAITLPAGVTLPDLSDVTLPDGIFDGITHLHGNGVAAGNHGNHGGQHLSDNETALLRLLDHILRTKTHGMTASP